MFKSTTFLAIALLAFSSCTTESIVDPLVGDYYAIFLCSDQTEESLETQDYIDAEVREINGDRIAINFDSNLGSMTADVNEDHDIIMTSYDRANHPLATMVGRGDFSEATIHNSDSTAKFINLHFQDEVSSRYCMMQLIEKIEKP